MIYLIIETILLIGAIMTIILLSILLGIAEHKIDKASEILKKLDLDKYTYTKENRKHTINDLLNILQNGSEVK